ncbi:hypothetical protein [Brevundimonas sp. TWP2-3-2]|uniref:hypothetical protein n=1 Tax=unclassified Brevundimonas TaxID=2622653 RepID=UPI003CEC0E53
MTARVAVDPAPPDRGSAAEQWPHQLDAREHQDQQADRPGEGPHRQDAGDEGGQGRSDDAADDQAGDRGPGFRGSADAKAREQLKAILRGYVDFIGGPINRACPDARPKPI